MPKVKISEYSATANSNTDVASINIDEGCAPSGINNAIRAIMGHLKDFQSGTSNDPFTVGSSGSLTLSYGTINGVAYLNGSRVLTTGSALVFDGTNFTAPRTQITTAGTPPASGAGFEIVGGTSPVILAYNRGTSAYLPFTQYGSAFTWSINGSSSDLILTSTGMGIGTTTATGKLSVNTGAGVICFRDFTSVIGSGTGSALDFLNEARTTVVDGGIRATNLTLAASGATPLIFNTNGSDRARIDSSGNLLVGQTSKSQTTVGFYAAENGEVSGCLAASTNSATQWNTYSTGAGAYRFYVGMGGTIFATSIVITAISDERLKENVRDIDTGLDSIMALKPRRFDWKDGKGQDKKNAAGFIAQEFEDVFPECVSTSMAGADGIEYKNINHETLIPTLVKAIQELKAEFDAYKASHP